jgi:hypothetical protein
MLKVTPRGRSEGIRDNRWHHGQVVASCGMVGHGLRFRCGARRGQGSPCPAPD